MPRTTEGSAEQRSSVAAEAAVPGPGSTTPVKLHRPDVSLADKYLLEQGTVFLSGIQALVRVLLDQHRADRRRGAEDGDLRLRLPGLAARRAGQGDHAGWASIATDHALHFAPGLNEELAATAVYGSQLAPSLPGPLVDGVVGVWYGKNPGLDRAMPTRCATRTSPVRTRTAARSRSSATTRHASPRPCPSAAEATLAALHMPTFFPGTLQEVLDFGLHAMACSRASGLWSAMKVVTNIADSAGTVQVWPGAGRRGDPGGRGPARPASPTATSPNGNLLAPTSMDLERTLFGVRLEIARQYAALNQLNPVTVPTRDAWLGVVAAGKVYYELVQALDDLGLDQRELERAGIRLMKVGMLYPHDRESFRAFARGLEEVLVVEEKLPFLETALRDALYGTADAPRIVGKRDEHDAPLVAAESDLDADAIARGARVAPGRPGAAGVRRRAGRADRGAPRRDRAHGPDAGAHADVLLGLPAQHLDGQPGRHAARRRHRLSHDDPARARGQGHDHRHHADGRRGRAVRRHAGLHRGRRTSSRTWGTGPSTTPRRWPSASRPPRASTSPTSCSTTTRSR